MFSNHPLSRRTALKVGLLGSITGLSNHLRLRDAFGAEGHPSRAGVLVFLKGGPSHQDTFDLKPNGSAETRGEFRPIRTNVDGIEICEHLPRLARRADRYAILRALTHNLADHGLGTEYLVTGNRPTPVISHPAYGSVASRQLACDPDLPVYVAIDDPMVGPGYLGNEFGALATGEKPRFGFPFSVRGISLGDGVTVDAFNGRASLLGGIDDALDEVADLDDAVRGLDRFSQQALDIITSPRTRDAFDLSREPTREIDRFGRHEFGQCLMLTARLIEAGVRFVTVLLDGWDTHQQNFNELAGNLLPPFDQALAAFLDRLEEQGRLTETAVLVTGEFGRTPKVNNNAGRDHWARAMSSLMVGGAVQGGQVIGVTDAEAAEPVEGAYSPDDLAASFYQNMGIDPKLEFDANIGRPITLVRDGSPIDRLFH